MPKMTKEAHNQILFNDGESAQMSVLLQNRLKQIPGTTWIIIEVHGYCTAWWARLDSNQRPIGYEPTALPLSYGPHLLIVHEQSSANRA